MSNTLDHFSIDLETLSTKRDAAILSIGAQEFSPSTGKIGGTYYAEIDLQSAMKAGRVDADTIRWWVSQDAKAKRVFSKENKKPLSVALDELLQWMRCRSMAPKVWGNGATFDITIIESAYENGAVGLQPAWHYVNIRDVRTVVDIAQSLTEFRIEQVVRVGVHHNALDDATYQANLVIAAYDALRRLKGAKAQPKKVAPVAADEDEL